MFFVKNLRTRQREIISNVHTEYTVWDTQRTKKIFKAGHQYYLFFDNLLTQLGAHLYWFEDSVVMVSSHHYMTPHSRATSGLPDLKSHRSLPFKVIAEHSAINSWMFLV